MGQAMLGALPLRQPEEPTEQLLKLYWNRASVKRELKALRRERFELLDKLKEQEGAILRAQEQLEGLERLLTNPLAAANAMVYFQLRHLWRIGAQRLEQFRKELQSQREKRERTQLHEAAIAKRKRRLDAINEKLAGLAEKHRLVAEETTRVEQRLASMNRLIALFRAPQLKRRLAGLQSGRAMLDEKVDELRELAEKIQGEPLPEPEELSIESRRLINTAVIALAQHLVVHFAEHDLASLAKTSTERAVGDMKFGDRRDCDRMVERIREKIEELKQQKTLADNVKKRTDLLLAEVKYRGDNDSVPMLECLQLVSRSPGVQASELEMSRRASDAPLRINVLADDYWDLLSILR
jgi:DNA repair exonuclease SbcCD ATPase subunit